MELRKPGVAGISGMILSIIGMYMFLGLDLNFTLLPNIQIMPIIGGVILGIGFSLLFFERNIITTGITSLAILAMSILNWWGIGFSIGLLLPGITGKVKSFPVYLAALLIFIMAVYTISSDPGPYKESFLDNIVNMSYASIPNVQSVSGQEIEGMLPSMQTVENISKSIFPCNSSNTTCLAIQNSIAQHIYAQTHSEKVKEELANKLSGMSISKNEVKEFTAQSPIVQEILDNISYIIAGIRVSFFLLFSLAITIPQKILDFFLGLAIKKSEPGGI